MAENRLGALPVSVSTIIIPLSSKAKIPITEDFLIRVPEGKTMKSLTFTLVLLFRGCEKLLFKSDKTVLCFLNGRVGKGHVATTLNHNSVRGERNFSGYDTN
jgi:hypothetical protein